MTTEKKIKITPEFVKTLFDGKKSLLDSGKKSFFEKDFDEAIATLRTLTLLKKDHVEANYFLAAAYKKNGELEEAKKSWTHIRDLYPEEINKLENEYNFFLEESKSDLIEQARKFAQNFIEKHFSKETHIFDILFDSIKEIVSLDQIQTKNLAGALGITGKVDILKTYKSPVIIKSAIDTFKIFEDLEKVSEKEIKKRFKDTLIKNNAPDEIVSKID